jgi:hypothetical protein
VRQDPYQQVRICRVSGVSPGGGKGLLQGSGKMLADHRGDRRAWLTEMLGLPATDPARYRWEQVQPEGRRLHAIWQAAAAFRRRPPPVGERLG